MSAPTVASAGRQFGPDLPAGLYLRNIDGQEAPVLTNVGNAERDRSGTWLRIAMGALAVLAATSAIVSYEAQFLLVYAYKHVKAVAELQAAIPDVSALVFAALGIALALHGKRAVRARLLNVAAVGTSIVMNALASSGGWKALAIWTLAPVSYAVTSDTLIGVLRAHVIAKQRQLDSALADEGQTPLAVLGRAALYTLRLIVAPKSTVAGARRALLAATPVPEAPINLRPVPWPPAQAEAIKAEPVKAIQTPRDVRPSKAAPRTTTPKSAPKAKATAKSGSKQADLIRLATEEHGLAELPLKDVSKLATSLAPQVNLHEATARRVLVAHARSLQNGGGQ